MKEFWNVIQAIFAAVGGWLGYFLGGNDGLLYALLAFVVLDYITGVMCAVADKKLSSAVGFKGIGLQGDLQESSDLCAGRYRAFAGYAHFRRSRCLKNRDHFLLHLQRRPEPCGECSVSGASDSGKASQGAGAAA